MTMKLWSLQGRITGMLSMMSEESYNNLMENLYVMGSQANYDWLMESKEQLEKGMASVHSLVEVGLDE